MNTRLEAELEQLRTTAPANLAPSVLVATGVVHGYASVDGPTGDLFVAFSRDGVTQITPVALGDEAFASGYVARTGYDIVRVEALPDPLARPVRRALESGKLGTLPVDLSSLTRFQQDVLRKTAEIPPGEMRPYGWVAREIGNPGAVRAVGSALNKNPVPVVIPCHRVGRSDGTVGRYAYGPEMKRALLQHEGADPDEIDSIAERGVRLTGSDTTHIYCFPTCRHARRTSERHQVEFRSDSEARNAGYRPCKVCKPAAA